MHAHDIRAEFFHLLKIFRHRGPLGVPIVFEQTAKFVVIVIETPRLEGTAGRVQDKSALIGCDADGFEGRRCRGEGDSEWQADERQQPDEPQQRRNIPGVQPDDAARWADERRQSMGSEIHLGSIEGGLGREQIRRDRTGARQTPRPWKLSNAPVPCGRFCGVNAALQDPRNRG